ncbi:ribonuclease HII [Poseidonibacter sp.]|uniref:ribonuclease HII n=1 Tax=Poseidonibacter sp. TaxID=2321188 RepID=UPI003C73A33C
MVKLCGIDEAGRGPIAGPLVVAGVVIKNEIKGLNDSKQLSEKKREALFDTIKENTYHHIVFTDAKTIDEIGLSLCLKNSILEIMQKLQENSSTFLMDGNTSFGIQNLEHKIKADATVQEVSAASILAKVSRDRYMCEIAGDYPNYNFQKHKGYGTKAHVDAIKEFGRSDQHRFTFKLKALGEVEIKTNKATQKSLF